MDTSKEIYERMINNRNAMNKHLKFIVAVLFLILVATPAQAQIFKKLGDKVTKAVERGVENVVERKTQEKVEEKTGDVIDGVLDGNKKRSETTDRKAPPMGTIEENSEKGFEDKIKGIIQTGELGGNGADTNCPVLGSSEMEEALSLSSGSVEILEGNSCGYNIILPNNEHNPMTIMKIALAPEQSKKEIENYKKESGGMLSAQKIGSTNGYFCYHKPNNWLIIYNPALDFAIKIDFSTVRYAPMHREATMASYETAKKNATAVANYLIKNL